MVAVQIISFVAMFVVIAAVLFVLMVGWIGPEKKSISDMIGEFVSRFFHKARRRNR